MKKICTKCKKEKLIDDFGNRENCSGKVIKHSVCRECLKEKQELHRNNNFEKLKQYDKNRYINNIDENKENSKEWYKNNKDKRQKWNENNKEGLQEYRKEYYKKNKEKISKQNFDIAKNRRLNEPLYKLKYNIRSLIGSSIRRKGYKKKSSTQTILNCSFDEFKTYLESKFELWMNWENYGKYNGQLNFGWDIDHIIPLSSAKSEEEIIKLNHYTNLRPLDSYENFWRSH